MKMRFFVVALLFVCSMAMADGLNIDGIRKAAEQGDLEAMWHLSQCYSSGNGVPKDFKEAFKWCQKAAEYGYIYAQGHLVMLYADGRKAVLYPDGRKDEGVPKDYVLSYMWDLVWCENAKDKLGYIGSDAAFIGRLSEKMSPDQIERAKELARNWKPKIQKRPEPQKMQISTPPPVIQGQPGIIEDIPHPPKNP